jgi:hypothetical protein
VPRAAQQDGLGSSACSDRSAPRELMSPRPPAARPTCLKLPRRVAAARTRSYKRIRRPLINRRCGLRYIPLVNRRPRNALPLTRVERAADPSSRTSTRSTVRETRVFRCRANRNASARCLPERMDSPQSGKRCKRNDDRSARIPQPKLFLVRPDDLGFADCNSDFDPLWPAAPPRRGCLRLSGVGRDRR